MALPSSLAKSANVDFKAAGGQYIYHILPQDIEMYGSAYLNSPDGGTLYLGVLEDGTVTGIRMNQGEEDHVVKTVFDAFRNFLPEVSPSMINVRFLPIQCSPDPVKVVEIRVHGGPITELFENGSHKVYIKRDGCVKEQNPLQIRDLVISRYKMHMESQG